MAEPANRRRTLRLAFDSEMSPLSVLVGNDRKAVGKRKAVSRSFFVPSHASLLYEPSNSPAAKHLNFHISLINQTGKKPLRDIRNAPYELDEPSNAAEELTVEMNATAQIILAALSGLSMVLKGIAALVTAWRQPPPSG